MATPTKYILKVAYQSLSGVSIDVLPYDKLADAQKVERKWRDSWPYIESEIVKAKADAPRTKFDDKYGLNVNPETGDEYHEF